MFDLLFLSMHLCPHVFFLHCSHPTSGSCNRLLHGYCAVKSCGCQIYKKIRPNA
jgi:hypothetical protein